MSQPCVKITFVCTVYGAASKSNDAEKDKFLAQVEKLPLTSKSRTHRLTDKSKISMIMMICLHV